MAESLTLVVRRTDQHSRHRHAARSKNIEGLSALTNSAIFVHTEKNAINPNVVQGRDGHDYSK